MLEALRNHSAGIFAKILFFLLMISFGVWGIGDMVNIGSGDDVVARIGDSEIAGGEYDAEFARELRRLQSQLGDAVTRDMARAAGMDRQVLQRMVTRTLYAQGARDLGVVASDASVVETVRGVDAFKNADGTFDRNRFEDVLRTSGLNEQAYMALVRADLMNAQYTASLRTGVSVPTTMAEVLYAYTAEKRIAEILTVADDQVPAPASPTDAQLAQYHQANAAMFTAPEYRAVTALVLTAADVMKETVVSDTDIKALYDDRAEEFKTPEKRTLRQMVLSTEADAKKAAEMIVSGASFADAAQAVAGMDAASLELGTMDRTQLLPDLADAAFAATPGTATAPVKSPLGWHLFEVVSVTPARVQDLQDVRETLRREIAADRAIDGLYTLVNKVEDELGGGATIEEAARALNITPLQVAAVDHGGLGPDGKPVAGLPDKKEFLDTLFSTDEGTDSLMVDAGGDTYFVLRVDSVTAPALKPLADVRAEVLAGYMAKARQSAAEDTAKAALEKAKTGTALADLAQPLNAKVTTTAPFQRNSADLPRPLVLDLFGAKIGDVAMARGANGYVIGRLTAIEKAAPKAATKEVAAMAASLSNALQSDVLGELANGLRNAHPVEYDQTALARRFADDAN